MYFVHSCRTHHVLRIWLDMNSVDTKYINEFEHNLLAYFTANCVPVYLFCFRIEIPLILSVYLMSVIRQILSFEFQVH